MSTKSVELVVHTMDPQFPCGFWSLLCHVLVMILGLSVFVCFINTYDLRYIHDITTILLKAEYNSIHSLTHCVPMLNNTVMLQNCS